MSKSLNILLLDNYDSFTHNLFHYLDYDGDCSVTIKRNDEINLDEIEMYDSIVLSPGPGLPSDAGLMMEVIDRYHTTKKMLGVCLGHQAIAEFFGAKLKRLQTMHHGISNSILTEKTTVLYKQLPRSFKAGRYHSWYVSNENFPDEIMITAVDSNQHIMSIQHKELSIFGVQYHPESILSEFGIQLIRNWKTA